ncbi:uncharacterized protein CGFF_03414 [Nakaseomyces glabratus]|nr:TEA domain profile [Nakaseomyces glabratus]QNG16778.1 uncharacterized protein GWK60_M01617 [Nakaseomyces glabratus]SCV15856.1 uncharacterized protein CGFF_03414 [Nakaseomyces glabratus]SLM15423.1 uncharacterized protein CGFF_03414 [Nakaseomyces glabratus]
MTVSNDSSVSDRYNMNNSTSTSNVSSSNSTGSSNSSGHTQTTGSDNKWPMDIESAFVEALGLIIKNGTSKIKIRDRNYGRNELISMYIWYRIGKYRTKKQISSHIQVWKKSLLTKKKTGTLTNSNEIYVLDLIENGPQQTDESTRYFYTFFESIISTIMGNYPAFAITHRPVLCPPNSTLPLPLPTGQQWFYAPQEGYYYQNQNSNSINYAGHQMTPNNGGNQNQMDYIANDRNNIEINNMKLKSGSGMPMNTFNQRQQNVQQLPYPMISTQQGQNSHQFLYHNGSNVDHKVPMSNTGNSANFNGNISSPQFNNSSNTPGVNNMHSNGSGFGMLYQYQQYPNQSYYMQQSSLPMPPSIVQNSYTNNNTTNITTTPMSLPNVMSQFGQNGQSKTTNNLPPPIRQPDILNKENKPLVKNEEINPYNEKKEVQGIQSN